MGMSVAESRRRKKSPTYNPDGRLTGISSPNGNASPAYDHSNRATQTTLPNGDTEKYSYNAASQLTGIDYRGPSGSQIGNILYGRDALGRVTQSPGPWRALTYPPPSISSTDTNMNHAK
jgi:YD repeat-containing protein